MVQLDPEEVRTWWRAQGLPDKLTDPTLISQLVTLAFQPSEPRPNQTRASSVEGEAQSASLLPEATALVVHDDDQGSS